MKHQVWQCCDEATQCPTSVCQLRTSANRPSPNFSRNFRSSRRNLISRLASQSAGGPCGALDKSVLASWTWRRSLERPGPSVEQWRRLATGSDLGGRRTLPHVFAKHESPATWTAAVAVAVAAAGLGCRRAADGPSTNDAFVSVVLPMTAKSVGV